VPFLTGTHPKSLFYKRGGPTFIVPSLRLGTPERRLCLLLSNPIKSKKKGDAKLIQSKSNGARLSTPAILCAGQSETS
jgi:hypothetical protein